MSTQTIEVDFDRIALVTASDWNHNSYYDDYLLQHLPKNCDEALDNLSNFIALPVSIGIRALRTGRLRPRREVRQAWNEHGRHDTYSTFTDVKELCAEILPGAKLRKHLLWRYSIVWEKP